MRITLIGSGNVATHLGAAFRNAGHHMVQVYSPNMQNAALLAYHIGAEAIDDLSLINPATDIFVIAISDDAIGGVAGQLTEYNKLIVHTSGAVGLDTLLNFTTKAGVFYPLQTFSKTKEVDFIAVPLCLEAADAGIYDTLEALAAGSHHIYKVDSEQRKVLHLAAVFACNFPNYLYSIAQQLLAENGMQFNLLRPLILETALKVQIALPGEVQTGPAVRRDAQTMTEHIRQLTGEPEMEQLYRLLSQGIIKNHNAGHGSK
jgi:predicted short-subunit dehydrogenase-like oxidoreductase (DUF2520 family)